jgi:phospholipid transport system substrate-binding protein
MQIRPLALSLVVFATALPALSSAVSAAAADPSALVTGLDRQLKAVIADSSLTPIERQRRFRGLLDDSFDFATISHFVLGHYWLVASAASRQEFSAAFEDYVIQTFGGKMGEYSGQTMIVTSAHGEGDHNTIVSTTIGRPSDPPPTPVDWRVLDTPNGFKVTDVSISGISLALSFREQFAAVIDHSSGHLSALVSILRSKLDTQPSEAALSNNSAK